MPDRLERIFKRFSIGRRGACLVIFGFITFIIGSALFVTPNARDGKPRTIPVLELVAPAPFWAALWMLLGSIILVSALMGVKHHRLGFILGFSTPLVWGAAYFTSFALGELGTGWVSAVIYWGYASLVIIISGWEEPSVLHVSTNVYPPPKDST